MGFRTVVVKSRCKLEYSLNYLICRSDGEKKICLDEINTVIVQNTAVALTASLLSALTEKGIKVIFCDAKSNPQSELIPYYCSYNCYEKILLQQSWDKPTKDSLWKLITKEKISNQAKNLKYLAKNDEVSKLNQYCGEVQEGDTTNREGHAAQVYFVGCFGKNFSRSDDSPINAFLNYGYSIFLSAINREVKNVGYLTEVGIHHIGGQNPFNLSCDLMEPLRPYVDYLVISKKVNETNFKDRLIAILDDDGIAINESKMIMENAIHLYIQSILLSLKEKDLSKVVFPHYELT